MSIINLTANAAANTTDPTISAGMMNPTMSIPDSTTNAITISPNTSTTVPVANTITISPITSTINPTANQTTNIADPTPSAATNERLSGGTIAGIICIIGCIIPVAITLVAIIIVVLYCKRKRNKYKLPVDPVPQSNKNQ